MKDKGEDDKTFDVYALSAALYRMKKVNQNYFLNVNGQEIISSFQEIAKDLLSDLIRKETLSSSLFFYANNGKNMNQRSYIMSIMYQSGELEDRDKLFGNELRKQMYYYRNCYHDGFIYVPNTEEENNEMLCLTREIIWGISSEAMVALVFPDMVDKNGKEFLEGKFFDNFNSNYLFMYVFLLHQKIALYQFLCKISEHQKMSLEALEEYGKELYQFETDFEYSRITDVPQYQKLYEMLKKSLGIPQLFHDVVEPLEDLRQEKERIKEKQQSEQEQQLNITLGLLGLLAIFSALVDSFDFFESFLGELGCAPNIIFCVQIVCIILIIAIFIYVAPVLFSILRKIKNREFNKQNQESYKKKRSD